MKKTVLSAVACLALAGTSFAGTVMYSGKDKIVEPLPPPPTCFSDTEFQVDLFGAYRFSTENGSDYHDNAGGGVGFNFFFARYFGIGADTSVVSGGVNGVWNSTGSLILRYPMDEICLAPYILGGGGYQYDGQGEGTWHAGGGLEYRVVPHRIGLFSEGRYTWAEERRNDSAQVRAGVRIVF